MFFFGLQKLSLKEKSDSVATESKVEDSHEQDTFSAEKKKKKRKRKQVDDLRFAAELGVVGSKRKERKKKYGFHSFTIHMLFFSINICFFSVLNICNCKQFSLFHLAQRL